MGSICLSYRKVAVLSRNTTIKTQNNRIAWNACGDQIVGNSMFCTVSLDPFDNRLLLRVKDQQKERATIDHWLSSIVALPLYLTINGKNTPSFCFSSNSSTFSCTCPACF